MDIYLQDIGMRHSLGNSLGLALDMGRIQDCKGYQKAYFYFRTSMKTYM